MQRAPSDPGRKTSRNDRRPSARKTPAPPSVHLDGALPAAVLAAALAFLTGCSSRQEAAPPQAVADPSVPADPDSAQTLMDLLDRDLQHARLDPDAAAYARERLRGRLLAANLSPATIDAWADAGR